MTFPKRLLDQVRSTEQSDFSGANFHSETPQNLIFRGASTDVFRQFSSAFLLLNMSENEWNSSQNDTLPRGCHIRRRPKHDTDIPEKEDEFADLRFYELLIGMWECIVSDEVRISNFETF